MSLTDIERKTIVELELQKSKTILEQIPYLVKGELWELVANRLYYGAFHAVCALLIHNNLQVGTHKGAVVVLNKEFVKTGKISIEDGRIYSQLQALRERGDYNCYINTSKEEITPFIDATNTLVEHIVNLINN